MPPAYMAASRLTFQIASLGLCQRSPSAPQILASRSSGSGPATRDRMAEPIRLRSD